jgi:chromosome partitioning protein
MSNSNGPRIFAIANRKGGVGKTTTTINVATAMAAAKKKVLVIDLDPQGNASTSMGINKRGRMPSVYDILIGNNKLSEAVVWTDVPNFSLVPSSPDLAGAEVELVDLERREYRLKDMLGKDANKYDYVLIDCPPSLNMLTINALTAANAVIVPLQCEFLALEGVTDLIKNINQVKALFNPGLELHGVVLTMYDKRNNLTQMVEDDVRGFFGDKVYKTVIPRNVRISEAPSHGKPVLLYDFKCPGSQAYISLVGELFKKEKDMLV